MTTKLEKDLRREVDIGGKPYTVTLSPQGMKLTEKGRRKGQELRWQDWVNGEAALAVALNASLSEAAGPTYKLKTPPKAEITPQKAAKPVEGRPKKKKHA